MISSSSERTHVHDVVKLLYNKFGQGVKQRTVSAVNVFLIFLVISLLCRCYMRYIVYDVETIMTYVNCQ